MLRLVQMFGVLLVLGVVISLTVVDAVIPPVAIFFLGHISSTIAQITTRAIIVETSNSRNVSSNYLN